MVYALDQEKLDKIHAILAEDLIDIGAETVLLIDTAGNIIATLDNGLSSIDVFALAALAAGNFGAVSSMAQLVGENDFSLLFHKGSKENIHLSRVKDDYLLITIFDNKLSLGYLRLKVAETVEKLSAV